MTSWVRLLRYARNDKLGGIASSAMQNDGLAMTYIICHREPRRGVAITGRDTLPLHIHLPADVAGQGVPLQY
jgi:hypothetical protein